MYNLNEYKLIYIKNNINIFYPLYQYILYYPSTYPRHQIPITPLPFPNFQSKAIFKCTIFENYENKKMSNYYKNFKFYIVSFEGPISQGNRK